MMFRGIVISEDGIPFKGFNLEVFSSAKPSHPCECTKRLEVKSRWKRTLFMLETDLEETLYHSSERLSRQPRRLGWVMAHTVD